MFFFWWGTFRVALGCRFGRSGKSWCGEVRGVGGWPGRLFNILLAVLLGEEARSLGDYCVVACWA